MKPIDFPGVNATFAKHQPEYLPLPAQMTPDGAAFRVRSLWQLSWRERFAVLFGGTLWLDVLCGGKPNPVRPWVLP